MGLKNIEVRFGKYTARQKDVDKHVKGARKGYIVPRVHISYDLRIEKYRVDTFAIGGYFQ